MMNNNNNTNNNNQHIILFDGGIKKWKRKSNTNDIIIMLIIMMNLMYQFLIWVGDRGIFLSSIEVTLYNDSKTVVTRKNETSYNDSFHD